MGEFLQVALPEGHYELRFSSLGNSFRMGGWDSWQGVRILFSSRLTQNQLIKKWFLRFIFMDRRVNSALICWPIIPGNGNPSLDIADLYYGSLSCFIINAEEHHGKVAFTSSSCNFRTNTRKNLPSAGLPLPFSTRMFTLPVPSACLF